MKKILPLILFFLCAASFASTTEWQELAPGLQYTQVYHKPENPLGTIHAFKINLHQYQLALTLTNNTLHPLLMVKDLVMSHHAMLGINGGFFDPQLEPIGLRIKDGKQLSPLKPISWWGIFYIANNKAYIVSPKHFKQTKNISFAVQSGPRLVINDTIPSLKPGWSFRSALGITKTGNVIIAITNYSPITTTAFATILKKTGAEGGLDCVNAINLDGGSSSQLYAEIGAFSLNVPSFAPVSDVVLVLPK